MRFTRRPFAALLPGLAFAAAFTPIVAASAVGDTFSTVLTFARTESPPVGGLVLAPWDGGYFGVTRNSIYRTDLFGAKTTVHTFTGADGTGATGELLADNPNQVLYGVTTQGGAAGLGAVYRLHTDGRVDMLASFDGSNGSQPSGTLVRGSDGALWGTTLAGGSFGHGVVFRLPPSGAISVVHAFDGSDGDAPRGPLAEDSDGTFYGTASAGGPGGSSNGVVFRLAQDGTFAVVHAFAGAASQDCANPMAGLAQASDGAFYGTAQAGGKKATSQGCLFEIDPRASKVFSIRHNFAAPDGVAPRTPLAAFQSGLLYGSTDDGTQGGTVFTFDPASGSYQVVHKFHATVDGANPVGAIFENPDHQAVGVTGGTGGPAPKNGTAYTLTPQ